MKSNILILLLACMGLCACEKNIDIDFHNTTPMYAVEGWLSPYQTYIRVSKTKDMSDTTSVSNISNAVVTITDEGGHVESIPYTKNDVYASDYTGEPGKTYKLDVVVDGHHFTSTSTMYSMPTISSVRLVWKKMMSERYIFCDIRIKDIANEENFYYVRLYRNGVPYRSAVLRDDTNPGKELQQLIACNRDGSTEWDALKEGDEIEVDVRTIDERSYDYLYSLLQMKNTSTNPIDNFTGGCLGYFSAFCIQASIFIFHASDIQEEE